MVPFRDLYLGESAPICLFFHGDELVKDECWNFEGSEGRTSTGSLTDLGHQTTEPQPVWLLDILPTATTMNTQGKTMALCHRECSC